MQRMCAAPVHIKGMKTSRGLVRAAIVFLLATMLAGCPAGIGAFGDSLTRAFNGVPATLTTYTQGGVLVDEVHGSSFRVSRDDRFDTSNSDGTSKQDSSVLMISLGNSHISHVGSTLILAQDGLKPVQAPGTLRFDNVDPGTPWLNDLKERFRNVWAGKAKTIVIRSQDGTPISVFTGNQVEIKSTDVPKSTWFRVDGKYLFVYRADYTVVDSDLIGQVRG